MKNMSLLYTYTHRRARPAESRRCRTPATRTSSRRSGRRMVRPRRPRDSPSADAPYEDGRRAGARARRAEPYRWPCRLCAHPRRGHGARKCPRRAATTLPFPCGCRREAAGEVCVFGGAMER